jgi:hypothetical protein
MPQHAKLIMSVFLRWLKNLKEFGRKPSWPIKAHNKFFSIYIFNFVDGFFITIFLIFMKNIIYTWPATISISVWVFVNRSSLQLANHSYIAINSRMIVNYKSGRMWYILTYTWWMKNPTKSISVPGFWTEIWAWGPPNTEHELRSLHHNVQC